MTISLETSLLIPIAGVNVPAERQRSKLSTDGLRQSILRNGLINPILVEETPSGSYLLIAGERRLTACKELGWAFVPARLATELSPPERQLLELEENQKRQDLDWQDAVKGMGKIHSLYCSLHPGWNLARTAEALNVSLTVVSVYLRVERDLEDQKVQSTGSVREAYNMLVRRDHRANAEILDDLLSMGEGQSPLFPAQPEAKVEAPASEAPLALHPLPASIQSLVSPASRPAAALPKTSARVILHESFAHWAPKYSGPKFNLLHCDFPYGIKMFAGEQGAAQRNDSAYEDSPDVYWAMLEVLSSNLDRLLSHSAHVIFWYSEKHGKATREFFASKMPSLRLWDHPLVWLKTDNVGIAQDTQRGPRHIYETALLASRGDRKIVRIVADAYAAPTDKSIHVSCKPEPMLRHFLTMLVDEHTRLLDPTCGSATALRAAESLGADSVLGMDIDDTTVGQARRALDQARALRATRGGSK
jgi:ParB/RepB/Spo0J family partition protein